MWDNKMTHLPAPQRAFASSGPMDQLSVAGSYTSTNEVQTSGRKSFFHFSVTDLLPPAIYFTHAAAAAITAKKY